MELQYHLVEIYVAIYSKIPENIELWIMRGAVFGVGAIAYLIAIFGSEGLIQLLLGAYGPIAQLALQFMLHYFLQVSNIDYHWFNFRVCITIYYQYFADSTLYDLHAGLIGLIY